jgi:hypothetical protein
VQGFFGPSVPDYESYNPYNGASSGTDFVRNHQAAAIDFATIHGAQLFSPPAIHIHSLTPLPCLCSPARSVSGPVAALRV